MTLPYIYQSTHSISFSLSPITHSIPLPCKMDGKEGQSVDADFWHPVESISHQHRYSKFLMKSRIIWSNYDHDQQSKNQGYISLHVTEINDLHCTHFTSFHVAFYVILCRISHILLYTLHTSHTYHACRTFRISHISRISCIAPHITLFYVSFHVISS